MPKLSLPRKLSVGLVAVAAGALCIGLLASRMAKAQPSTQPPSSDAWKDLVYEQSGKCADCHTSPIAGNINSTKFVMLTESSIWRVYDKHAQAYAVLEGERGKQISKVLFGDEGKVLKAEGGCVSCHAMQNLSQINEAKGAPALDLKDGVSCTG